VRGPLLKVSSSGEVNAACQAAWSGSLMAITYVDSIAWEPICFPEQKRPQDRDAVPELQLYAGRLTS